MSTSLPSSRSRPSTQSDVTVPGFTCPRTTPDCPQLVAMSSLGSTYKSASQIPSEPWPGPSIVLLGSLPRSRDKSERIWPKVDHASPAIRAKPNGCCRLLKAPSRRTAGTRGKSYGPRSRLWSSVPSKRAHKAPGEETGAHCRRCKPTGHLAGRLPTSAYPFAPFMNVTFATLP